MKIPGPDHPITIAPNPRRVRVTYDGHVIADSTAALVLREASYPAVHYLPREDVDPAHIAKTDKRSHCPYKGEASYFSLLGQGKTTEDAAWSYETPFPAMAAIARHLAFYPDKVTIEEV